MTTLGWLGRAEKSTKLKLWCFCSAECGFESRSWYLCPWARHITILAFLHPGVKGYLRGQRWFLWLISLEVSALLFEWFKAQWPGVIMLKCHERHCVTDLGAIDIDINVQCIFVSTYNMSVSWWVSQGNSFGHSLLHSLKVNSKQQLLLYNTRN